MGSGPAASGQLPLSLPRDRLDASSRATATLKDPVIADALANAINGAFEALAGWWHRPRVDERARPGRADGQPGGSWARHILPASTRLDRSTPMKRRPDDLRGALVLVTGAGSGIGEATASRLRRPGCLGAVRRHGRRRCGTDGARLSAGPDRRQWAVRRGRAYTVDVADRDAMTAMAAQVAEEHGPLDVLVNNAGVGMSGRFLAMSPEDWDWILGINLMGVVHGCQAFGPAMVERGRGHVVNLSSGLAYMPRATEPGYVTSKAAVLALSRCLRADWGARGVGVSAICPGVIATPIIERTRFRGDRAGADTVGKVKQTFAKGHPPALVAEAIVGAVVRNRAVVAVGIEARIGWALNGLLPSRVVDAIAKATPGRDLSRRV